MFELHHIGSLVDDIDAAVLTYQSLFGGECASDRIFVSTQGVQVCFINTGNNVFIELIQPVDEKSTLYRMRKKGVSYYHMGYKVNNFKNTVDYLIARNFKALNAFYSEAFENKRCQFLYSPEGSLIELIEI
jgi:methylmalonyl-CoA/ethylmalonyl-CoA epimerase